MKRKSLSFFLALVILLPLLPIASAAATEYMTVLAEYDALDGAFYDGLSRFQTGGKWGFLDMDGNIVIQPVYDDALRFRDGVAFVKQGGKWGGIDVAGNQVTRFLYDEVMDYWAWSRQEGIRGIISMENDVDDGNLFVESGGKWGIISTTGKVLVPPEYDLVYPYRDGVAFVKKGDLWGFYDDTGKLVLEPTYTRLRKFFDGFAFVQLRAQPSGGGNAILLSGYIDKMGKPAFPLTSELGFSPNDFHEGLAVTGPIRNYNVINTRGEIVVSAGYFLIDDFMNGIAQVEDENRKCGLIDKTGKLILPMEYDGIAEMDNGLLKLTNGSYDNEVYGLAKKDGTVLVEPVFSEMRNFKFAEGMFGLALARKDRKYGFIDANGDTAIPFEYGTVYTFTNTSYIELSERRLAAAEKDGKWGYLDLETRGVGIPFEYDEAFPFKYGYARVKKGDYYGIIDMDGNTVIPCEYTELGHFNPNYDGVVARKGGVAGIISKSNQVLIPLLYDDAKVSLIDGVAPVKLAEKWGLADARGRIIVPAEFDDVSASGDLIIVKRGNQYGAYNAAGQLVFPVKYDSIQHNYILSDEGYRNQWTNICQLMQGSTLTYAYVDGTVLFTADNVKSANYITDDRIDAQNQRDYSNVIITKNNSAMLVRVNDSDIAALDAAYVTPDASMFVPSASPAPVTPAASASDGSVFPDLPETHWAYDAVVSLAEKGIIRGTGNGHFEPEAPVNNASFLAMLGRALYPGDVKEDGTGVWWQPYYNAAIDKGIAMVTELSGTDANMDRTIYRIDVARYAVRADIVVNGNPLIMNRYATLKGHAAQASAKGLLIGDEKGDFNEYGHLTRAEAAVIIQRLLDAKGIDRQTYLGYPSRYDKVYSITFSGSVLASVPVGEIFDERGGEAKITVTTADGRILGTGTAQPKSDGWGGAFKYSIIVDLNAADFVLSEERYFVACTYTDAYGREYSNIHLTTGLGDPAKVSEGMYGSTSYFYTGNTCWISRVSEGTYVVNESYVNYWVK